MGERQAFAADVGRVLDLVIHSLYTHREIFLRELISNASDACDKLRYESLSRPELLGERPDFEIRIVADKDKGTLTIADDGIGMTPDEMAANLGTVARSGTAQFLETLSGDAKADSQLIGKFGVGFYAAFMVADEVAVFSKKAGVDSTWVWRSDGRTGFTLDETDAHVERGTAVVLKLKDDAKEFLEAGRIKDLIRTYSDHVAFPIRLGEPGEAPGAQTGEPEQINTASALWRRPKSEITDEQYTEFYHHSAHAFDPPLTRLHFSVEGVLTYTGLLFVPSMAPFDLYDPHRRHGVKLYVRRVFITDHLDDLLPRYLRFVSGVVDSDDLQLNVSRETLQKNAIVAKMRQGLVKRVLDELERIAKLPTEEGSPDYLAFWEAFGAVLKEGMYEDGANRERLTKLARFRSTHGDGWTSLEDYAARMKPGQDAILTISGDNVEALKGSPQLEQAKAKGVEVLLLTDAIDDFWLPVSDGFDGKPFKSLTRDAVDLSQIEGGTTDEAEAPVDDPTLDRLLARMKLTLQDAVKDVRRSKRLTESAVCLVADEGGFDLRFERFLKQHKQLDALAGRILEVNPTHPLIRAMAEAPDHEAERVEELARLLLDQARVVEGEPLPDPGAFSRRMGRLLQASLQPSGTAP
ncbi:MAG: molecular chaperone HtpG [Geminicoccaceae bacterium]|nr:MAG: molecular chaperone HtpG [Geminicoccaceae bacterium]